jgi:hypothetical protein
VKIDEPPSPIDIDIAFSYFGKIENGFLNIWDPSKNEISDTSYKRIWFIKECSIIKWDSRPHTVAFTDVNTDEDHSFRISPYSKVHSKWFITLDMISILVSFEPIKISCGCHSSIEELQFDLFSNT